MDVQDEFEAQRRHMQQHRHGKNFKKRHCSYTSEMIRSLLGRHRSRLKILPVHRNGDRSHLTCRGLKEKDGQH